MKQYNEETLEKIQKQLDFNCPSPESDLVKLGLCVATLPSSKEVAKLRHLVLDVDDLTSQIRWHLGQALLILDSLPYIRKAGEDDDDLIKNSGIPIGAYLLLRNGIVEADRVIYGDLSTPRRGGTVGGWIFHMMIDSAVYRSISALDRLATILYFSAGLPIERVYFRSGDIEKLNKTIDCDETASLLKIVLGELFKFIISYRNGLTHSIKSYSRCSGISPAEHWRDEAGHLVVWKENSFDAEMLLALGRASYREFTEALELSVRICEKKWPIQSN